MTPKSRVRLPAPCSSGNIRNGCYKHCEGFVKLDANSMQRKAWTILLVESSCDKRHGAGAEALLVAHYFISSLCLINCISQLMLLLHYAQKSLLASLVLGLFY
jgi:hypothetical protein